MTVNNQTTIKSSDLFSSQVLRLKFSQDFFKNGNIYYASILKVLFGKFFFWLYCGSCGTLYFPDQGSNLGPH